MTGDPAGPARPYTTIDPAAFRALAEHVRAQIGPLSGALAQLGHDLHGRRKVAGCMLCPPPRSGASNPPPLKVDGAAYTRRRKARRRRGRRR